MKGIYILIIRVEKETLLSVGALGALTFNPGLYAYVGSAQANLGQRIKRHLRKEKRLFWHIDYLLSSDAAKVVKVLYKNANKTEECAVANSLSGKGAPMDGFGCSDCDCKSHLFRIGADYRFLLESMKVLS
ncbi:MAG: GIY-YIG nuclease family protein [Candidatus Bathyarchaeota archaeon]|nr:GIY-YIG nuclease family protein [Candidatus Bathyarchaeota archaeon]